MASEGSTTVFGIDEASLRFVRRLATDVPLAVIATDAIGIVCEWSREAEALYGWTAGECVGKPITSLTVDPLDASVANAIMAQVAAGRAWSGRYHARNKRGDIVEVFVIDVPLHAEDGSFSGVVGLSIDMESATSNPNPRWVALKSIAAEISEVRERERNDLAKRLHDDVAQVISMARLQLSEIASRANLPADVGAGVARIFDDLDVVVRAVREMTGELHFRDFDVWLLVLRLFDMATELESIDRRVAVCEIALPVDVMRRVSPRTAYVAYNIAREAVANVRRHSQAGLVRLRLDAVGDDLHLTIEDNGVGIGGSVPGIGRAGMHDRAASITGRLEVTDRADAGDTGTRVLAVLPLSPGGGGNR